MSDSAKELMAVCEQAARAGAAELLAWRGRFRAREKGARDLVTDADLASERAIRKVIGAAYPDHGIVGEESPVEDNWGRRFCWVVDPLDGTANYVHGVPCYSVSVAVTEAGRLAAAAVLDPERDECFLAFADGGATLNGEPIRTSGEQVIARSLLAVSFPPQVSAESPDLQRFLRIAPLCQAIRRTGSAALNLAYVACGRFDGHWAHEIFPWDSAAGVLLVQEAGGVATASDGRKFDVRAGDYLAAASAELHARLLAEVGP